MSKKFINMEGKRFLIFGLDLSLHSSGISIAKYSENSENVVSFNRVVFDEGKSKTGKAYKPTPIQNCTQYVYGMPKNLKLRDMHIIKEDYNAIEQNAVTLRTLMCAKIINEICAKELIDYKPDMVIVTIENYVLPTFSGATALTNVSGLF